MAQPDRLTKPLDAPARLVPSRTDHDWVAVDVETATPSRDSLCAIGAVRVKNGVILDSFQALVRPPGNVYNPFNTRVHGMGPETTEDCPGFGSVAIQFWAYVAGRPLVAHNVEFDADVIKRSAALVGASVPDDVAWYCTLELARATFPEQPDHKLVSLCARLGIDLVSHHRASHDAFACAQLGNHLLSDLGVTSFDSAYSLASRSREASGDQVPHRYSRRSSHPKVGPGAWTDADVASAQRVVDLWLSGAKLREIDELVGTGLGNAASLLQRLRKNGLDVPAKTRGRGSSWAGPVPESLRVEMSHLGRRLGMAVDTPPDARIVVFTGEIDPLSRSLDRTSLESLAQSHGWIVRGSVSRRTTVVVVCDPLFTGTKRLKAQELGIRCVSPDAFLAEIHARAAEPAL